MKYQVLYSTVVNPTIFTSLGTYDYVPHGRQRLAVRRSHDADSGVGSAGRKAYAVEINWNVSPAPLNAWSGYSEIVVQGTPSPAYPVFTYNILPTYAETVVGDKVVFTVAVTMPRRPTCNGSPSARTAS